MMYNDVSVGEIPILSFLRGTDYAMYVGPMLSSSEHEALRKLDISIPVIYLPEVLEGLTESRMKYNFPGVTLPESLTVENIYAQIRKEFDGKITEKSRLIIKYNGDVLMMYDAKESGGSFGQLLSFLRDRYASYKSYGRNVPGSRRLLKSQHNEILDELRRHAGEMDFEKIFEKIYLAKIKPCLEESVCSRTSEGEYDSISDYHFQSDMDVAARDAQGMIENLLLNGCPPEMILQWVKQSVKISRLRITRHFKIFLTDYDNAEVKLGPLPKTVFLFFLRHPEGVMFSHLMDHRKELQMIYERVCTNDDPQKMRDSIKRLTDPLDNSISEKCAAVKKAFILNIADNIACNYYISGAQGEKKGIPLDRSLVEWECEL
jgi:aromatic ring-cleaving dioxygenase